MEKFENLTVCMGPGAQRDYAEAIAKRIGKSLSENIGDELTLMIDKSGVSLLGYSMSYQGDFERMLPRITEGRLSHELLVHTAKTKTPHPTAIDATAGMGEDSLLLAAAGYEVTMFEQNPVIAALLKDALRRAKKHPFLKDAVSRMHLIEGDSTLLMKSQKSVDLIYLDPMFPARQKSGLIGKKLQLIQRLESPCSDENTMLQSAFEAAPKRIIVKRPLKGSLLAGKAPQYSVKGKSIRYDCYGL